MYIDFVTQLSILINYKDDSYNIILVIVNYFKKMVHYKLVKITIDVAGLVEDILDIVMRHYGLLDLIMIDKSLFITSKFWSLLCYFF